MSTSRDNHCLSVCVNTGTYPGTRITRPTSSEMAEVASVHGSGHPVPITKRIDLTPIDAQPVPSKPTPGLEPGTPSLRMKCSTN
jgi:hypothetical protein